MMHVNTKAVFLFLNSNNSNFNSIAREFEMMAHTLQKHKKLDKANFRTSNIV